MAINEHGRRNAARAIKGRAAAALALRGPGRVEVADLAAQLGCIQTTVIANIGGINELLRRSGMRVRRVSGGTGVRGVLEVRLTREKANE